MKSSTPKILKALRNHYDKTQLEVAEFLGVSRQAYSRYESNLREPNMEILKKIATYYDVSPQLFYLDDIDKLIDADMDIVEMVARYQLKQILFGHSHEESQQGLDRYIKQQDKDQITSALSQYFGLEAKEEVDQPKTLKQKIVKYGFYALILLFLVNIGIMTLHRFDPDYQYDILNHSYVNAVTPGQNVNQTMFLDIVRVKEFNPDEIEVGDQVVIFSDFGLNEYFVETVTSIESESISTTYENTTTISTFFDDVTGVYQKEANLFGTIYYTSKFNTGYLLLILGHIILLAMYYLSFVDVKED